MRDNSRRVGTHEKNSGDANCRLGTITQSIFCPVRSQHSLNRFEMVCLKSLLRGRDPLNQNFRKFQSKTHWIGSVQPEKFRKNGSTFWSGPGPVGILVEWIAPRGCSARAWKLSPTRPTAPESLRMWIPRPEFRSRWDLILLVFFFTACMRARNSS